MPLLSSHVDIDRLDLLRGFSGAEKLVYVPEVRDCVVETWTPGFHALVGCPAPIFHSIGKVLEAAKAYKAGTLPLEGFQDILDSAENFLRNWDVEDTTYPTADKEWRLLASAFRHGCLLRIMRWPETFSIPCENEKIRASVGEILDICAAVPRDSTFYKRLLFPLFLAAADTKSAHQIHYADLCLDYIKVTTGFPSVGMTDVLEKVWYERREGTRGWTNVPWMEFVSACSSPDLLQSQY